MDHPWRRLRTLVDWTLQWALLPGGVVGVTDWAHRTITLDVRLTQVERRCTIAHELEHVARGPAPAWDVAREEAAVDDVVARYLIPLDRLAAAVAWSLDPHEIADELWVDVPTLEARARGLTEGERAVLRAVVERR